jgi:hypothetical protein
LRTTSSRKQQKTFFGDFLPFSKKLPAPWSGSVSSKEKKLDSSFRWNDELKAKALDSRLRGNDEQAKPPGKNPQRFR